MLLKDLHETTKLPVLVDGRDIFLRRGEQLVRAVIRVTGDHVYVSPTTQLVRGDTKYVKTFPKPKAPNDRFYTTVAVDHLEPYPEDARLWQSLIEKSLHEMSAQDLQDAERVIEYLFKDLKLDVVWTTHFKDRIQGREADVTKFELAGAFQKMKEKYGQRLTDARNSHQEFVGVLKDLATELNIPFAIDFDRRNSLNNKYKLRGITIMRKDPKRFVSNISGGAELSV